MGLLAGYCLAVASLTEPKNILTVVQGVIHICSNPEALNTFPFIPAFTPVTLEGPHVHRDVDTTPGTLGVLGSNLDDLLGLESAGLQAADAPAPTTAPAVDPLDLAFLAFFGLDTTF